MRIEGNDIYLTPARYLDGGATTWAENAIDLKAGSSRPRSTRIDSYRMWGFRRNAVPTARGELLVIQWSSRNVVVTRNIFGDAHFVLHRPEDIQRRPRDPGVSRFPYEERS